MKAKKIISLALCAVMLVALSVAGTLAYLTDSEAVTNTFTVGKVYISLHETNLSPSASDDANTEEGNSYHLLPGMTYTKDPTVTVLDESEECYVRMLVTVSNMTALKEAIPQADFPTFYADNGLFLLQKLTADESGALTWNPAWECVGYEDGTYEFRYNTTVNGKAGDNELPALFTDITVPGEVDETQMPHLDGLTINVVAHAIQAAGFADADAAWAAFGIQNP